MRLVLALLAVAGFTAAAMSAPPDETLTISTFTFSDEQFLKGEAEAGTPAEITATLRFPEAEGRRPVVILMHGTDGPQSVSVNTWRSVLLAAGMIVVRPDSYSGRGLTSASEDQESAGQFWQIYDAYRIAEALGRRTDVDPARIVLMGFSRGATATLYAAMQRFHDLYGPEGARIAAYVPVYAGCNFELATGLDFVAAPVRLFHGADDSWTLASTCAAYVERLKAAGHDVQITIYPGAEHAFDSPVSPGGMTMVNAQTSRNCMRVEMGGVLINRDTGKPFSYADSCVETGPRVRYNDAAFTAAQAAVIGLIETLGP